MTKKEVAKKLVEDKQKFHGSVTVHYADGEPKKIEYKEVQDLK